MKVVAEIGGNHRGDFAIAKEMVVTAAKLCKVDAVKFQKRNPKESLTPEEYKAPHPAPEHSYGATYGAHREFLEFNIEQHRELKELCGEHGVEYSCSVWDMTSAKEIISLGPLMIKIPSAHSDNFEILEYLCGNFPGEIHVSMGMTTKDEIEAIVQFFEERKRNQDMVLYHCTSGYPIKFEELNLLEIERLKKLYRDTNRVKAIGFSGHHLGIAADIAAMVLGAEFVERHFTLDRTWKGSDQAASLEPAGLTKLVRDLHNVAKGLTLKEADILEVEKPQWRKLKWKRNEKKIF